MGLFELPSEKIDPLKEVASIKNDLREVADVIRSLMSDTQSKDEQIEKLQKRCEQLEAKVEKANEINEKLEREIQELKIQVARALGRTDSPNVNVNAGTTIENKGDVRQQNIGQEGGTAKAD